MPADYHIDVSRKLIISTATGILTADEMVEHQKRLRNDPMFRPDFNQIIDFSGAVEVRAKGNDIRRLAYDSPFRSGSRRALIAPRPELVGIARMFKALTEEHGAEIRLCDDLAEASQWLGIDHLS